MAVPIIIILSLLTATGNDTISDQAGEAVRQSSGGGIAAGIGFAVLLMLLFRRKYPRWWFDFVLNLDRFCLRVGAYLALLTDRYPSTDEEQSVHLEIDYPDATMLNRLMPIVKWLLAIPHYVVLLLLVLCSIVAVVLAWFAILFTGRYPRGLFDFVVGTMRWGTRVNAYAFMLVTDRYPPFSMT
ncbi:MAG: DUF4389 domain-containing protein [Chloroflexi bacterium]|nr:DUF4389 domain-containing protein [Chloroflexota bacterium]